MYRILIFLIYFCSILFSQVTPDAFQNYFLNNKNVMLFIDPTDGKIVKANTVAKSFYGYDNLTSKSIQDINAFTKEQVLKEIKKAKNEQRNYFIFNHILSNGSIQKVRVFSYPIEFANKKVLYSTIYPLILEKEFIQNFNTTLEEQVLIQSEQLQIEHDKVITLLIFILGGSILTILFLLFLYRYKVKSQKTIQKQNETIKKEQYKINQYIQLIDNYIITSSTDLNGNITEVSDAYCKISGYSKEELIGQNHRINRHPDLDPNIHKIMWETITHDKTWQGEIMNQNKSGKTYWIYGTISPKYDEDRKKIGYTSIRQDITNKKLIEEISLTDGLTDIFNRRYFNEIFPKTINSAKRNNALVSFLIMDIDYFKQYNDTYGHQKGDEALIKVAQCIKNSIHRADDNCFRLGGEEFGVIFKTDSKEKSKQFANKVRQNIESLHIEHSGNSASVYMTISVGLVCKNANEIKDDIELYKDADEQLYRAKELGRNKVMSL